jgi:DNA-directed RNA polymerase subunit RPC12/RpoP
MITKPLLKSTIYITTMEKPIDKKDYNFLRCEICGSKIGWKPHEMKVHSIPFSKIALGKIEPLIFTCWKCELDNLLTIDFKHYAFKNDNQNIRFINNTFV